MRLEHRILILPFVLFFAAELLHVFIKEFTRGPPTAAHEHLSNRTKSSKAYSTRMLSSKNALTNLAYACLALFCDSGIMRIQMSLDLQPSMSSDSFAMLAARDRDEMRGAMADVLQDIGELKLILSTHPPEDAEVVMQAIQEACSLYRHVKHSSD